MTALRALLSGIPAWVRRRIDVGGWWAEQTAEEDER